MNAELEIAKMSNLIADMTIAGASTVELERAITHSMATIDYIRSEQLNGIAELMMKYQGSKSDKSLQMIREARELMASGKFTAREAADALRLSPNALRVLLGEDNVTS